MTLSELIRELVSSRRVFEKRVKLEEGNGVPVGFGWRGFLYAWSGNRQLHLIHEEGDAAESVASCVCL